MSIIDEIEEYRTGQEKVDQENPGLMSWLHHNFAVIKSLLALVASATDLEALQTSVTALSSTVTALEAQIAAIEIPEEFDPSALQAAIQDLQDQIDAIVIPVVPPPFAMPDGTDGQILTHGPGGNGDFFFADAADVEGLILVPGQTGDLIPVNEGTDDEALLPEFCLDPDGRIIMVSI